MSKFLKMTWPCMIIYVAGSFASSHIESQPMAFFVAYMAGTLGLGSVFLMGRKYDA